MATKTYTLASEEGVEWLQTQQPPTGDEPPAVGDEVELDLPNEQETALVAAGWLDSEAKKAKGGTK